MMKDHTMPSHQDVEAFSYVDGRQRRPSVTTWLRSTLDSTTTASATRPSRLEKQERVPMMVIVKMRHSGRGSSREHRPGNRGKRDSQIILMSFLQKVMFDERMTELEFEMFNAIWKVTGISPDFYEVVLMVDADTKIFPDSMSHMISAMVKDPEIMGLCGETKIANKRASWVSMIQVFE